METQAMSSGWIWFIVILAIVMAFFIYRERQSRARIREALHTLEDIIAGNENRRIHVGAKEPIAPLIFKINELVDSYQKVQVSQIRNEHARKQLLSNLSHDVRTPLTSVLGYLDALCEGKAGEEEADYLRIARNKAYSLKEYLDELFIIARLDADELRLDSQPIDLYELLRSELIGFVPILQKANIKLQVDIPDEDCEIIGDPHAVKRIVGNLLQNAMRYGGEQGVIGVSAGVDNRNVHFEIWDQGPGISADELDKVFDRLYKVDSSRSTKGHGLGLTIAKELVQQMNGTIQIESEPYVKTTVRVTLPRSKKK
jgi:signal transduction histidine kinase